MTSSGSWGDIIEKADGERFIGREYELNQFRQDIIRNPPRYLIFYITGQGGVGKTTVLNRYREISKNLGFLLVDCDEEQRDVPSVLGRFARQLAEQGFPLKRFEERYKTYRQKLEEIEHDPENPQGIAALVGQTLIRGAYVAGDMVPVLRKGLEFVPREALETQASRWAEYLAKKFTNKDELLLMHEPQVVLTPLFFQELNAIAEKHNVLLCFENFEVTGDYLQTWLLRLPELKPSQNIRVGIASRTKSGAKWESLRSIIRTIELDVFTEQEANDFLDAYAISDPKRREEILTLSNRLPVVMSWLAAPQSIASDPSVPDHDIVDHFLRWVSDQDLRQAALLAAIPQVFNLDIIKLLLDNNKQSTDPQAMFEWLRMMPFVTNHAGGWQHHPIVRRKMLYYQRKVSPQSYHQAHAYLADFYNRQRNLLSLSPSAQWANEKWKSDTLAYIYHALAADPYKHWPEVVSLFTIAIRERPSFAIELAEALASDDIGDELPLTYKADIKFFSEHLDLIRNANIKDTLDFFQKLATMEDLSPSAKASALLHRGLCHLANSRLEEALDDLDFSVELNSEDAWAIAYRGEIHRQMGQYDAALTDFNCAISSGLVNAWIWADRGETYRQMGQYDAALADFNQSLGLNPEYEWAIASRGQTYRQMGKYANAIKDFDHAISLNESDAWAIAHRGETFVRIGQFSTALKDFDRAISLNESDAWAIAHRGETYRQMGQYSAALADFDRAIQLDPEYVWAIASRGETYRQMSKYFEAISDFNQAINHYGLTTKAIGDPGDLPRRKVRYDAAQADYNRAINLDSEYVRMIASRGETYRRLGQYEEALINFNQAIDMNSKYAWAVAHRGETLLKMERYDEALADFNRAVEADPHTDWYRFCRARANLLSGNTHLFMEDLNTAIELAKAIMDLRPNNYRIIRNLALYYVAGGYLDEAEAQYSHFQNICNSVPELRGAEQDLTDLLMIQPGNQMAEQFRNQFRKLVALLKRTKFLAEQ